MSELAGLYSAVMNISTCLSGLIKKEATVILRRGFSVESLFAAKRTIGNMNVTSLRRGESVTRDSDQHSDIKLRRHDFDVENLRLVVNTEQRVDAACI